MIQKHTKRIIAFLLLVILLSCDKSEGFIKADLVGYDPTLCACCGGWVFQMDEVNYTARECPEIDFVKDMDELPIKVKIKFKHLEPDCGPDKRIDVSEIKQR